MAFSTAHATCPGCTSVGSGVLLANTTPSPVNEASGIAVSATNNVIWMHNDDGEDARLYAFAPDGAYLAQFNFNAGFGFSDFEDMALGPGPVLGVSYLYVGDIGSSFVRASVNIFRVPEPAVSLGWAGSPRFLNFTGGEVFTLSYPDGSFDAETLLLDPVSGDLFVGTKQNGFTRLYRANLNGTNHNLTMDFIGVVGFSSASGGAISANGGRIILRNENTAAIWIRCEGETVGNAMSRPGRPIPVMGVPTEPNGEAIAFTPDSTGYVTVSDNSVFPPVYFFPALCSLTALGTEITQQPQPTTVERGSDSQFHVAAGGTNLTYQWRFNGFNIPDATSPTLTITNAQPSQAGNYSVLVSGDGGSVASSAARLSVVILPPVIATQPPLTTLAPTGSTVHLTVGMQGTPPFNYAWSFGRRALDQNSATLTLPNVQRANSGKYRVTVTNSVGKVTSAYATLKVLNPPVIIGQPLSRTNQINSTASFRVRVKGSPRLRYQWFYEGVAISNAFRPTLSLRRVQPAQSGQYSVMITNSVGAVLSAPAQLTVP